MARSGALPVIALTLALGQAFAVSGAGLGAVPRPGSGGRSQKTAFLSVPALRGGAAAGPSACGSRPPRPAGLATRMAERGGDDNPAHLDPKFEGWVERSWAKAEMLERAFALQMDVFTADAAVVRNKAGEQIDTEKLRGKSVALYFASQWCGDCRSFTPLLKSFYEEQKDKIEIVFVSSDFAEEDAMAHYKEHRPAYSARGSFNCVACADGDWLMLDYNSPMREEYKLRYGVWSGKEAANLATSIAAFKGRKAGIPALVVLSLDGDPVDLLDAETRGLECLLSWDPKEQMWPPAPKGEAQSQNAQESA